MVVLHHKPLFYFVVKSLLCSQISKTGFQDEKYKRRSVNSSMQRVFGINRWSAGNDPKSELAHVGAGNGVVEKREKKTSTRCVHRLVQVVRANGQGNISTAGHR